MRRTPGGPRRTRRAPAAVAVALAALLLPAAAAAHGVVAEVERQGDAVAVRLRYHGGKPLAGARYDVRPPAGSAGSRDEGRTDRHGWVVFTPDVPGTWTVRIVDASGHGRAVDVEVEPPRLASTADAAGGAAAPAPGAPGDDAGVAVPAPAPAAAAVAIPAAEPPGAPAGPASLSRALRPLGGAAAIALVFLAIVVARRRRAAGR